MVTRGISVLHRRFELGMCLFLHELTALLGQEEFHALSGALALLHSPWGTVHCIDCIHLVPFGSLSVPFEAVQSVLWLVMGAFLESFLQFSQEVKPFQAKRQQYTSVFVQFRWLAWENALEKAASVD